MAAASGWTPTEMYLAPAGRARLFSLPLDWTECADHFKRAIVPVGLVRMSAPRFRRDRPRASGWRRHSNPGHATLSATWRKRGSNERVGHSPCSSNLTAAAFAITPDATYDAITAFLDEKASTRDSFVEEYGNDIKDANDPNLQLNIYVLEMTHGRSFLRPASGI
jgi:hypothetical protein